MHIHIFHSIGDKKKFLHTHRMSKGERERAHKPLYRTQLVEKIQWRTIQKKKCNVSKAISEPFISLSLEQQHGFSTRKLMQIRKGALGKIWRKKAKIVLMIFHVSMGREPGDTHSTLILLFMNYEIVLCRFFQIEHQWIYFNGWY